MGRKRRSGAPGLGGRTERSAAPAGAPVDAPAAAAARGPVPPEPARDGGAGLLLALMMFLAPAVGVPHELMLQDTLKSIIVSFGALGAALLFLGAQRGRHGALRWHAVLWLPLMLMAYALGSMAWSHAYLGGVEAVRWFVFSLLAWLGLQLLTPARLAWLAWGVHAGAVVAALWAALQFWSAFSLFPQGPNPASTFINRNFFAEFVVCTLPFGAWLLARARRPAAIALLAASNALVITAILMTGTRAALMALWLQLLLVLPLIGWRCRGQLAWPGWRPGERLLALGLLVGLVLALAALPSGNPKILEEGRGVSALERALNRTQSIRPGDESLNLRMVMWRATLQAIQARPLAGLGAGAWESEIPLYQAERSQLETDYYVHNEFLQLVAEYGLVGWAFGLLLLAYLSHAALRSWRADTPQEHAEQGWRAVLLCSLLALLLVSNIGFPWRLASTGALFALCLGALAASDARLAAGARLPLARPLRWSPFHTRAALAATLACLALALFITHRAAASERKLVQAAKLALSVSASGHPADPQFAPTRARMLQLVREGVALNPHYRKITPMVADELARWGDWRNALWIWESVLSSRPHVVAILSNVARAYSNLGQQQQAMAYLERAKRIQPDAPAVRSLEVILLARGGQERQALERAREALAAGIFDYDLANALVVLARRSGDYALAERALHRRMAEFPDSRAQGYLQLGLLYAQDLQQPERALQAFRAALALVPPKQRQALLQEVPQPWRAQLEAATGS